jgi:Xaa-Pro aminopeptidase
MAADGLDALLLIGSTNLLFLSGYPQLELTLARPFYQLVPAQGPPALLVHEGRAVEARRYSWVGDVRTYRRLSVAPLDELVALLRDRGLRRGIIGMELGREQRVGLPVLELERIREAVEPLEVRDAASLLWRLRAIKHPEDVRALREACRITTDAYARTLAHSAGGDLDRDVVRRMHRAMADAGGNAPWVLFTSGPGRTALATGVPEGRRLEPGDMVWMDAGCVVEGFWSDFSRAGVVGGPTPEQAEAHARISAITRRGVDLVRPGVPVAQIAAELDESVASCGLPVTSWTSHLAGRVGHGIGYDVTEPPHVSVEDATVLEPGMVISIEPGVATDSGLYHVEQDVLVTSDGAEVLSGAPWELATIPVSRVT